MWCLCLFGVVSGVFLGFASFPEFLGVFVGRGRPGPGGADRLWGGAGEGGKGRVAGCLNCSGHGSTQVCVRAHTGMQEHTGVRTGAHKCVCAAY